MSDSSDDDRQVDYGHQDDDLLSDDGEDEILASEDDEEDDDDDDDYDDDRFSRFKIEMKKDEMASDLEDDDDDDDDGLPNVKAWGKEKKSYYHTDYIDKDYRSQKQRDQDLAQYEEEEALQIQKRLLQSISDQDLGIDLLLDNIDQKSAKVSTTTVKEDIGSKSIERTTTIGGIPAGLTDAQKAAIVRQESPELELLKTDFEHYMNEINNKLEPLVLELDRSIGDSTRNPALSMLNLRLLLLTNYCAHISLYLSMKCRTDRQIVKDHPIIKRLFSYKKLIKQLDDWIEENGQFSRQIEFAVESIKNKRPIRFMKASEINMAKQDSILDPDIDVESIADDNDESDDDEQQSSMITDIGEKRAITYEMEKNKGLTPKRKREQRNPRVKYRKKYEKAVIRRKGQVRQPRKEVQKYGGEVTGINVRAVKSVKFK
ncbi:Something about silencing protein 10 [Dermatophagoides farinae]|uniref:Something about silencing protein 10 n=1 Tax=Dermatophagoides farinae TaxID=6954 RepID=A0A922HRA2_DERFA|nr:Something about silencing protein 10 [Dermatophagoides farinae]